MKVVSQAYKDNIKQLGKEISYEITYDNTTLGDEDILNANLHYDGGLLKSVMKQLDIELYNDIPIGTELNYKFGVKIDDDNYEKINYGNFIVYSSEKLEDSNTYKLICYDKMLYAMKDYESIDVEYPITIRDYITALSETLGLTFSNEDDDFTNYDKTIEKELYIDNEGNNIGYTYRDVLDEIAQATASTICINDNDELEIRYINNTQQEINAEYLKDINVNFGEMTSPINTITLKRSADSDVISLSSPIDLPDNLKNEIVISENQILNSDDRDDYMQPILSRLYGLSYCLNDYISTGITWLDLCDRYNVLINKTDDEGNIIESNVYDCVMFNDEINVNQGLQETIHTDRLEESKTDYNTTTRTDRLKTRTDLIVDKQNSEILAVTGVLDIQEDGTSKVIDGIQTTQTQDRLKIEAIVTKEGEGEDEVYTGVRTGKGFTFDNSGLTITDVNDENSYKTQIDEQGTYYYDGNTKLGETTKEGSKFKNMDLYGEFRYGKDDIDDNALFVSMKYTDDNDEVGFGHFWNGD